MSVVLPSTLGEPRPTELGVRLPPAVKHPILEETGKIYRPTATRSEHDDFLENTGAYVEDKMAGFSPG